MSIRQPKPRQIRLPFNVPKPKKGAAHPARVCGICRAADSRYTCPRCNIAYCSLACFRDPAHTQCSEPFYRDSVRTAIAEDPAAQAEERRAMLDMLRRFEEGAAEGEDVLAALEAENDEDEDDLAAALEGVDLDTVDSNELLRRLPPAHRDAFLAAISDPESAAARALLHSAVEGGEGERDGPSVLPWWEAGPDDDKPCAAQPPDIPSDVVGAINPPPGVGAKLVYNLVALCMAYVHALMSLRLPSLAPEYLTAAGVGVEEVRDELARLLLFLAERSTVRYESVRDAWAAVWEAMDKGEVHTLAFLLDTVATLFHPPITTDPPRADHVLADCWRSCRGGVARKLAFYGAASRGTPTSPQLLDMTDQSGPSGRIHVQPHGAHMDKLAREIEDFEDDHDYEALPIGYGWGTNMLAGAMAGISEHAAIFPVDSIKTRMQVLQPLQASVLTAEAGSAAASTATRAPMTTFSQHFNSARLGEGIKSLWRGVGSVILGAGPAHAAHFGMYEFVREIAGGHADGWKGVAGTAVAGASASITSDALMNPFDVIKQRMQMIDSPYRKVLDCARTVYRNEGIAAFYVSYPTTLTMTVPFTAVQFSAYEWLKGVLNPGGAYSPMTHVTAGGIAGGLAAAVTTPLDVAKTLLQTRGSSDDPRIRNARGMGEALRIIVERDGWNGLRRGMLPRVLTVAPSTAISWLSYEFFKVLIRRGGHFPETGSVA
ncbi:hypothetical protein CcaverHIS641_0202170 [Cutaneotrichosporon cavernicola]|nr:hypothetical protein CcaverHIS641_0202170 [Cutaneotrichosporon cavernicola]